MSARSSRPSSAGSASYMRLYRPTSAKGSRPGTGQLPPSRPMSARPPPTPPLGGRDGGEMEVDKNAQVLNVEDEVVTEVVVDAADHHEVERAFTPRPPSASANRPSSARPPSASARPPSARPPSARRIARPPTPSGGGGGGGGGRRMSCISNASSLAKGELAQRYKTMGFSDKKRLETFLETFKRKLNQKGAGQGDIKKAFQQFDADGSGSVSAQEFDNAMANLGFRLTPEDLSALFKLFDSNKKGIMHYEDFVSGLVPSVPGGKTAFEAQQEHAHRPAKVDEGIVEQKQIEMKKNLLVQMVRDKLQARIKTGPFQLRNSFKHFDKDGSGEIDLDEFECVLRDFGLEVKGKELETLFQYYDVDGNGGVDYYEFIDTMMPRDYSTKEHPLGSSILVKPYQLQGDGTQKSLEKRALSKVDKLRESLSSRDRLGSGKLSKRAFVEAMVEAPDFQFGMWEVEDALARVDMHEQYEVDYNEFLDRAVGEDHFLTGWKTEFLRPRHIRGSGDIVAWGGSMGKNESVKPRGKVAPPKIQNIVAGNKVNGLLEAIQDNTEVSLKARKFKKNPIVSKSELGASKRRINAPVPSDKDEMFAYGIRCRPSDDIGDVLCMNFQREAIHKRNQVEQRKLNLEKKRQRNFGGETKASLARRALARGESPLAIAISARSSPRSSLISTSPRPAWGSPLASARGASPLMVGVQGRTMKPGAKFQSKKEDAIKRQVEKLRREREAAQSH
eukprot:CAMPEP_0113902098 /NCGR_PEP_ID=MMETSP0780_2-20120614/21646_1 /TAXON_ID=652834 /ORGANISM="Palpitomonas bilix" /LENGTH=731 /DNA_ID=CAMNT_0000894835 /DNA_START=306 /DNA_END=2501 /DNA_ORIENTATION=- /assembly_acc=CAM_ASM_000599